MEIRGSRFNNERNSCNSCGESREKYIYMRETVNPCAVRTGLTRPTQFQTINQYIVCELFIREPTTEKNAYTRTTRDAYNANYQAQGQCQIIVLTKTIARRLTFNRLNGTSTKEASGYFV